MNIKSEEIMNRLQLRTENEKFFRFRGILSNGKHRDFEGEIDRNSFNISRIATERKTPQIQAIGTVRGDLNHTVVEVSLQPRKMTLISILISFIFITILLGYEFQDNSSFNYITILIFMPIAIGIFIFNFKQQSRKTKNLFEEIFGTKPLNR